MADRIISLSNSDLSELFGMIENINRCADKISSDTIPMLSGVRYLSDTELSEKLRVSKRTLANYRAKGEFGYYDLPGKILYSETEIEEFLQRHYLPPFRIGDD